MQDAARAVARRARGRSPRPPRPGRRRRRASGAPTRRGRRARAPSPRSPAPRERYPSRASCQLRHGSCNKRATRPSARRARVATLGSSSKTEPRGVFMQSTLVRLLVVVVACARPAGRRGVRHRGQRRRARRRRRHHRVRDEAGPIRIVADGERVPPERDGAEVERDRTEGRPGAEGRPGPKGDAGATRWRSRAVPAPRPARRARPQGAAGDRGRRGRAGAGRAAGPAGRAGATPAPRDQPGPGRRRARRGRQGPPGRRARRAIRAAAAGSRSFADLGGLACTLRRRHRDDRADLRRVGPRDVHVHRRDGPASASAATLAAAASG